MIGMDGNRLVGGLWCSDILAALSDYLDVELADATADKVELHLASCTNCKRFGADLAGMLASLSNQKFELTDEVETRLRLALAEKSHS